MIKPFTQIDQVQLLKELVAVARVFRSEQSFYYASLCADAATVIRSSRAATKVRDAERAATTVGAKRNKNTLTT